MILPNGRIKERFPLAPVRLLDFAGSQSAANWVDVTSTGSASKADAPAYAIDSTNALQITQSAFDATYLARYRFYNAAGWNCSGSDQFTLAVQYPDNHLPSRQRVGSSGTLELTWSSNGDGVFTNTHLITLGGGGTFCGVPEVGRNVWTWNVSDMTAGTGGANLANITNIRIRLNTASATDSIIIQGLWCGRRASPVVSIVFDDGWASAGLGASEACNIANAQGVPMTLSVIPALSQNSDGSTYLSAAEIAAIYAAGNSITVHGTGPGGDGALVDYADSGLAEVTAAQDWCRANGYDFEHYVYPGGAFNEGVLNVMRARGMKTARTLAGISYTSTAWAPATAYALDTYRLPIAVAAAGANKASPATFRYRATAISGTGTSGGTEPNWPTTLGATVIDNPGPNQITWTCSNIQYASRGSYFGVGPQVAAMPNWLSMNACPLNNQLTLTQVLAEVDKAIKKGEGIILYGHKLGAVADSLTFVTADFTSLITALALRRRQGLCDIMTTPQMYDAYTAQFPNP